MKNIEIVGIVNSYAEQKDALAKARREGKECNEIRLPAAIAWKRRVNIDKLFQAKRVIDEALKEIDARYADDEHSVEAADGARSVKPEYFKDYYSERGEIYAQDTDVDIRKVSIDSLEGLALTDAELDTIAFMIDGGE